MAEHIHADNPSAWGSYRMRTHLNQDHGLSVPMAWDVGRLHEEHLHAHVRGNLAALENECQAFYGVGDGTSAICRRPVNHPEIGEDGIGHSPQPIPIQPKAEEAPMNPLICGAENPDYPGEYVCTWPVGHGPLVNAVLDGEVYEGPYDHGNEEKGVVWTMPTPEAPKEAPMTHEHTAAEHRGDGPELAQHLGKSHGYHSSNDLENFTVTHRRLHAEDSQETAARHLWMEAYDRRNPDGWDTLAEETKGYWRRQAQIKADKERQAEIGYGAAGAERQERDGERQILIDRLICAMAGISFDSVWVRDESLSLRGAMRATYGQQAGRLMAWLERGGAMALPAYASLGEDLEKERALVVDMENTNNQLREQLATTGRQLQTALAQKDALFEEMGMLRQKYDAQLAEAEDVRARAHQALMQKLAEASALRDQLAIDQREHGKSLDAVQRQLIAAQDALHLLQGRWERVVPVLEQRLMARTAALDSGRAALRDLIGELHRDGWDRSTVYQRLVKILGEAPVTMTEPIGLRPEVRVFLDGQDISDIRHIERTDQPPVEAEEHHDVMAWARKFAAGEI